MEKQNDHKKFSKKIWVLSAGIIVILAIVLFAGIKNGFFLRKGDKILYAAYHTIKDQPETASTATTIHLIHGGEDPVIDLAHAVAAQEALISAGDDVTLETVEPKC